MTDVYAEPNQCKAFNCRQPTNGADFCEECTKQYIGSIPDVPAKKAKPSSNIAEKYPAYFRNVEVLTEVDVYLIHELFQIPDCSGALQHASKKILLGGVRTGNKPQVKDIKEAIDTLTRWVEIRELLDEPA